jgi:Protein of unknown function (DUF1569)
MKNVFSLTDSSEIINRIGQLTPETKGLWGKMSVAQMLAHCNVTYEMAYENIHPAPNAFVKFILKLLVKKSVVNETSYKKSIQTAPAFIINSNKDFAIEKERLVNYIKKTQELGESYFEGKESLSFGSLNKTEWNNMFYKHLDHHLQQFGV